MDIKDHRLRPSKKGRVERVTNTWDPGSPDYEVRVVLQVFSLDVGPKAGALARWGGAWGITDPRHGYEARYDGVQECWTLTAWRNDKAHELGTYPERLEPGLHLMRLRAEGPALSVIVRGMVRVSAVDSSITSMGRIGMVLFQESDIRDEGGIHIDSIEADPLPPPESPDLPTGERGDPPQGAPGFRLHRWSVGDI